MCGYFRLRQRFQMQSDLGLSLFVVISGKTEKYEKEEKNEDKKE